MNRGSEALSRQGTIGRPLEGIGFGRLPWSSATAWAASLGGPLALGVGLALAPWDVAGVALGAAIFVAAVRWPLPMLGIFLTLGPLDLSFLTGGFKELLPGLGGLDMNGIRLVAMVSAFALLAILDPRLRPRLWSPPVRWYVLFLLLAAATIPVSVAPLEGARLLFKMAWPLLVFLVVSHPDRTGEELDRLADWVLIGAAAIVVVNPLFVAAGGYEFDVDGRLRVQGVGLHENPFSFYLLFVVILSLTRFAARAQARYLLLATAAGIWMGLSLTRITFLAALVALGAAALYAAFVRRNVRLVVVALTAVAVVAVAFVPVALERTFGYVPSPGELWGFARDPVTLYGTINLQGRELYWGLLYLAWRGSPWIGLGLGSSSGIIQDVLPPEYGAVAHNEYLRLGTDLGWFGLALMLLVGWSWIRAAWGRGEWAFPDLAALVVWIVISITDNALDYYAPFTQFVGFAVAMAVARDRLAGPADDDRAPTGRPPPPADRPPEADRLSPPTGG